VLRKKENTPFVSNLTGKKKELRAIIYTRGGKEGKGFLSNRKTLVFWLRGTGRTGGRGKKGGPRGPKRGEKGELRNSYLGDCLSLLISVGKKGVRHIAKTLCDREKKENCLTQRKKKVERPY